VKLCTTLVLAVATIGPFITPAKAATMLFFDFGNGAYTTPGNYNNIITTYPDGVSSITNAIDSTGAPTPIDLKIYAFYNGIQNPTGLSTDGTTTPSGDAAIFDPQATRDYAYSYPGNLTPSWLEFRDLDPNARYELTIFASKTTVGQTYETKYIVNGEGPAQTVFLEPANNQSNVAVVSNVSPYATTNGSIPAGSLYVYLSPGPNNNNPSHVYMIGALRLAVYVPEPTSNTLIAIAVLIMSPARAPSARCNRRRKKPVSERFAS
jgi:hypothetical protein